MSGGSTLTSLQCFNVSRTCDRGNDPGEDEVDTSKEVGTIVVRPKLLQLFRHLAVGADLRRVHNSRSTKEAMAQSLFPRFAATVRDLTDVEVSDPRTADKLALAHADAGGRTVSMVYAPFDHMNPTARIAIVGLTPGLQQARNALSAARAALRRGASVIDAAAEAKVFASFSGPMRANLVAMLDQIGVARHLELASTALLWSERADLVHFTSALPYPVFVDGEN